MRILRFQKDRFTKLPHLLKAGDIKAMDRKKKVLTEEKQLRLLFREDLRGFLFSCFISTNDQTRQLVEIKYRL